jgi:hypothetical protein
MWAWAARQSGAPPGGAEWLAPQQDLAAGCGQVEFLGGVAYAGIVAPEVFYRALVAGVEEQFCVLGLPGELAGGVDVALAGEDRVGVHPVHLHRHPAGPGYWQP